MDNKKPLLASSAELSGDRKGFEISVNAGNQTTIDTGGGDFIGRDKFSQGISTAEVVVITPMRQLDTSNPQYDSGRSRSATLCRHTRGQQWRRQRVAALRRFRVPALIHSPAAERWG